MAAEAPRYEAKIHIFEKFEFDGKDFELSESKSNINPMLKSGDHRGLSSFIVEEGEWELYTETNFASDPVEIDGKTKYGPGSKHNFKPKSIRQKNDKTQSIKLLPRIFLFTNWEFRGGETVLTTSSADISKDFPKGRKGLSSFIIQAGKWSFYTEADYGGSLVEDINGETVFGPGKHQLRGKGLRKFNDETVSIKLVADV